MVEDPDGLRLEFERARGRWRATARRRGAVVYIDVLDPASARQRRDFAAALAGRDPRADAAAVDAELLRLAGGAAPGAAPPTAPAAEPDEIDASRVARPEQFYAPGLAGLTVPVVAAAPGGGPSARWVMYLQGADGRRERRDLAAWIDPPGGPRLWLHPSPGAPSVHCPPGWSADGRRAWLAGAAAPDPAAVFGRLADGFTRYVDWPAGEAAGAAATLAVWTLLTYCHQAWPAVPYLHVGGPLGSGKSRVMEVLARAAFRPLSTSNLTAPALFRTLHDRGGVVLYDEAERLRQSAPDRQELLSLLLAGYRRGGRATRLEGVGDAFRAVGFDVYGPKALACIAGLPPALASRCVPLTMFRAAPGAAAARRLPDDDPEGWRSLRDDLHALAQARRRLAGPGGAARRLPPRRRRPRRRAVAAAAGARRLARGPRRRRAARPHAWPGRGGGRGRPRGADAGCGRDAAGGSGGDGARGPRPDARRDSGAGAATRPRRLRPPAGAVAAAGGVGAAEELRRPAPAEEPRRAPLPGPDPGRARPHPAPLRDRPGDALPGRARPRRRAPRRGADVAGRAGGRRVALGGDGGRGRRPGKPPRPSRPPGGS